MKPKYLILIAILIATIGVLWVIFPGDDVSEVGGDVDVAQDTAALAGRIIDTSGRPLPNARVFAGEAMARPDDDGRFYFDELPAREIPVDATADGYSRPGVGPLGRPTVDLSDGEPVDDLELVMSRSASATGRIVAGGTAVEGAEISLSYIFAEGLSGDRLEPFVVSNVAVSETDGAFDLPELAPGRLQLMVEAENHPFTESREIYFRPGQNRTDIVIDLAPSGRLRGSVADEAGRPLRAELTLTPEARGRPPKQILADDDGRYSLEGLEEGIYSLRAEAEGYRTETIRRVRILSDNTVQKNIVLEMPRGLIGRVLEPDGTPVPGAQVRLEAGEQQHRLRTGAGGHFEWADAPNEDWIAVASSPGHEASPPTPINLDEEATLEVIPGGTITGRVVAPDGERVTDYTVAVSFAEPNDGIDYHRRHFPDGEVFHNGEFEIGPLRGGRYRLQVNADGYAPTTTDAISVRSGADSGPITIQLEESSSVGGVVRDAETGEPVEGVRLHFALQTPDNRPPTVRTDARGRYRFDNIPPGRASIRAIDERYVIELFGGINIPDGSHLDYDIDLEPVGDGQPGQAMQGIGAALSREDDGFRIGAVYEDSPAVAAGIESGDVITAVNGESARDMTLDQVVAQIRGEPGTPVNLDVHRDGRGTRTIDVSRGRVFIPMERQ